MAARENASSSRSVLDLKDIQQKIALKDKIDESREFASRVETSLYGLSSKSNPTAKNRGVKKAPFVVLIGASMPSVLAEIGFLTNSSDEALLRKPEHRQKIAEALYKGISSYADTLSHFQVAKQQLLRQQKGDRLLCPRLQTVAAAHKPRPWTELSVPFFTRRTI